MKRVSGISVVLGSPFGLPRTDINLPRGMANCLIQKLVTLTYAILFYLMLRKFFIVVKVRGASMVPTFYDGDIVLVARCFFAKLIRKDDIVVLYPNWTNRPPKSWPGMYNELQIKRVTGLPGDKVEKFMGTSKENRDYMLVNKSVSNVAVSFAIEKGYIFVCGDNEHYSIDSRKFGPLSKKNVFGIVVKRLYCSRPPVSLSAQSSNHIETGRVVRDLPAKARRKAKF
jgi:signal peptidase I